MKTLVLCAFLALVSCASSRSMQDDCCAKYFQTFAEAEDLKVRLADSRLINENLVEKNLRLETELAIVNNQLNRQLTGE